MIATAPYPLRRQGLGFLAPILDVTMKTVGLLIQTRMTRDAATRAKHERERQAAADEEVRALEASRLQALQQAAQVQAAATVSAGAGGGPVVLSSSGQVLGAGGILPALPGGSTTWLVLGVAVVGAGLFLALRRRA